MLRELLRELLQGLTVVLLDKTTPNHVAYFIGPRVTMLLGNSISSGGVRAPKHFRRFFTKRPSSDWVTAPRTSGTSRSSPLPQVRQLSSQTDARCQEPLSRKWLRLSPRMRARVASTMSSSSGIKSPDDTGVLAFGPGSGARAPVNLAALSVQLHSAH